MSWSLLIVARFHEGRYYGQEDGFNDTHGWPPSPGRLFQALVAGAAFGARLQMEDEQALKWLEGLDPPRIAAPAARRGRQVELFVPNNDLDAVGGDPARASKIRAPKSWRPYFFNADEPVLYIWGFEAGLTQARRICVIATNLYQLGRGVDMAWASGYVLRPKEAAVRLASHSGSLRVPRGTGKTATPTRGTLDSLVDRYQRKRKRLHTVVDKRNRRYTLFTQPPKASFAYTGYDAPSQCLHFELRGKNGSFVPFRLASVAPLITSLRDAAAQRLQQSLPTKYALLERLIIGRGAGPSDLAQRIRLIPIPSIGTEHTDLLIRRIMVEVPVDCPIRVDDLKWAFAGLPLYVPRVENELGYLTSSDDSRMAERFMRQEAVFRSLTPVALSSVQRRRIGSAGQKTAEERIREEQQAAGAIVQALRHIDIRARPTNIRVQREPFQKRGMRAELFADGSRFSKHGLWHAELQFRENVPGLLVLGDGRFCGLGLMEPIKNYSDIFIVNLDVKRGIAPENGAMLVSYLRRALMSLARNASGQVGRLFSGHESDGRPDSMGHHAHVFLAADGGARDDLITRLVVAAPWIVDRTAKPQPSEQRLFDTVTRQLSELRAGPLGHFTGLSARCIVDGDPLLGPANVWTSKTPYVATRNLKKRDDPVTTVKVNATTECRRRGLPTPAEIHVQEVETGPRGGKPTAKLKLVFDTAILGPVLLGRNSHAGGGLFHAIPSLATETATLSLRRT